MFTKARIQLSLLYVGIITLVIVVFSLILFHYTAQHIQDNVEEDAAATSTQQIIANRNISEFRDTLVMSDVIIIILSGLMSYLLAERTLKPITTALRAQEQFSANASHELRTPLAIMRTENEVFLKNLHSTFDEAHALAASNLEEINRMTDMVQNLLMLARSKKPDQKVEMGQTHISAVVKKVVADLEPTARAKNITLSMQHDPSEIVINGNSKLLEQAIFNIVQNAITYTEKGNVTVAITAIPQCVQIVITDTGIGISKDDIPHVLEPFYKADSARTTASSGVGLGLSIVKEIVHIHDGELSIQSELGKGTIVTVIFPTLSTKSS